MYGVDAELGLVGVVTSWLVNDMSIGEKLSSST
jgi:ABC-type phosphate transport system auxiliary subunit